MDTGEPRLDNWGERGPTCTKARVQGREGSRTCGLNGLSDADCRAGLWRCEEPQGTCDQGESGHLGGHCWTPRMAGEAGKGVGWDRRQGDHLGGWWHSRQQGRVRNGSARGMDDPFKEVPNFGDSLAEADQGSSDRGTGEGPGTTWLEEGERWAARGVERRWRACWWWLRGERSGDIYSRKGSPRVEEELLENGSWAHQLCLSAAVTVAKSPQLPHLQHGDSLCPVPLLRCGERLRLCMSQGSVHRKVSCGCRQPCDRSRSWHGAARCPSVGSGRLLFWPWDVTGHWLHYNPSPGHLGLVTLLPTVFPVPGGE